MESPHAIEILLMRVRPIRLRFRVHASRSNRSDRIDNIIRPKPPARITGVHTS